MAEEKAQAVTAKIHSSVEVCVEFCPKAFAGRARAGRPLRIRSSATLSQEATLSSQNPTSGRYPVQSLVGAPRGVKLAAGGSDCRHCSYFMRRSFCLPCPYLSRHRTVVKKSCTESSSQPRSRFEAQVQDRFTRVCAVCSRCRLEFCATGCPVSDQATFRTLRQCGYVRCASA